MILMYDVTREKLLPSTIVYGERFLNRRLTACFAVWPK